MKKSFDFLIILFVCLFVCGTFYLLFDTTDQNIVSNSRGVVALRGTNVRSHGGAVGSSNAWTSLGGESHSSSRGRISVPSYARSRTPMSGSASYSPITSSSISSSSSSRANYTSFGGGASGRTGFSGSAMSAPTRTQSVAYGRVSQPVAYSGGAQYNPSSSTPIRSLLDASSSLSYMGANVDKRADRSSFRSAGSSSSSLSVSSAYSSAYAYNSRGLSVYGDYIAIGGDISSSQRANGQRRAGPGGLGGSWENSVTDWLDNYDHDWESDADGNWWFTEGDALELYNNLFGENSEYWNEWMGNPPTEEDFLDWLRNNNDGKYHMPIGDIVPLFLFALAYMIMMFIRKR